MGLFSAIGGLIGSSKASKRERKSAKEALAEQRRQFDLTREDLAPYRDVGSAAITEMGNQLGLETGRPQGAIPQGYAGGTFNTPWGQVTIPGYEPPAAPEEPSGDRYGAFYESPGYRFRHDEAMREVDARGTARGRKYSGGTLREAQRYSSGLASQEYGNYFDRLRSAATGGQSATNTGVQQGQQYADNAGSLSLYSGASRASAIRDSYGAIGAGLDSALGAWRRRGASRDLDASMENNPDLWGF